MKTERLYYNDPYLLEFEAMVLDVRPIGDSFGVILDRTAFYPTSGGQPNDLGTINDVRLLDCFEDETSGVVILAKSRREAVEMRKIWEDRRVHKLYWAIVHGSVRDDHFVVAAPLGKDEKSILAIKDCVRDDGAAGLHFVRPDKSLCKIQRRSRVH